MANIKLESLDHYSLQLTVDFELGKQIYVVDILTQILLTFLIFIALLVFQNISIYRRWFLFGMRYDVNFPFR